MKTPATPYEAASARTGASYDPDSAIGKIFAAFKRGESLTSLEALERFGSFRLSAVVHKLKRDGMLIDSDTVAVETGHGKTALVACYWARTY